MNGHGLAYAQASFFEAGENRLEAVSRSNTPDPAKVRKRLNSLLTKAREAASMPWSDREARMWRIVFPNMANWLPAEEANELRLAFVSEMRRLEQNA